MSYSIEAQVRSLLLKSDYGTLSTHSVDCPGYPFASVVPVGFDDHNRPVLLISRLAQHTNNIAENAKVSLFLNDAHQRSYDDVQTCSRITVLAQAQRLDVEADADTVQRYCRFYRQAVFNVLINRYRHPATHWFAAPPQKHRHTGLRSSI